MDGGKVGNSIDVRSALSSVRGNVIVHHCVTALSMVTSHYGGSMIGIRVNQAVLEAYDGKSAILQWYQYIFQRKNRKVRWHNV